MAPQGGPRGVMAPQGGPRGGRVVPQEELYM